jgi:hypothetical protein
MYYTYMVNNIKDKREVRARLGKRTVKESMREGLWSFCKKILQK